jgi:hypothetical protein
MGISRLACRFVISSNIFSPFNRMYDVLPLFLLRMYNFL